MLFFIFIFFSSTVSPGIKDLLKKTKPEQYVEIEIRPEVLLESKQWWQRCVDHFSEIESQSAEYKAELENLRNIIMREPFDYESIKEANGCLQRMLKNGKEDLKKHMSQRSL